MNKNKNKNMRERIGETLRLIMSKSGLWKEVTLIAKEVQLVGEIAHTKSGWQCKHCEVQAWNKDLGRLLFHLCGDSSFRNTADGFSGVAVCEQVPSEVADRAKVEMESRSKQKSRKTSLTSVSADIVSEEGYLRARGMQDTIPGCEKKEAKRIKAENSISDLFDGQGWGHSIANGALWKTAVRDIQDAGPSFKTPCGSTLGGAILERQYKADKAEDYRLLGLPGVEKYGAALTTDGATIQRHPLLNVVLVCVSFTAMMLLAAIDASTHLATGASKDAEYVANQIIPVVRALPNPLVVDLIIADGASDMVLFRSLIGAVFTWIWSIWCISHIVNRILAKIGENEEISELIRKGKVIVDCFKSSKHFEHSLFESKCHEILHKNRALVRYCDTRFGLYFVMLHRILQLKLVLVACVTCPQWLETYPVDDEVKLIIMEAEFWIDIEKLIAVLWPLLQLLRLGDSNKPTLFRVYKATKLVRQRLDVFATENLTYMPDIISAFEDYEPDLLSDVAKAAAVTDVKSWANNSFVGDFSECKAAMIVYIAAYSKAHKKGDLFAAKAEEGMNTFWNKELHFASEATINKGKLFQPHTFFDLHCSSIPEYAEIAMRLASKPSASGAAERDHKDTKFVWDKTRNRLEPGKVLMLKHRLSSVRMKHRKDFDEAVSADAEFEKYWEKEDFVDPYAVTETPPPRTVVAGIQQHEFLAYSEDWEPPLLTVNEATDRSARYKLATKFKGMYLHEEDDDEWRVVVDLEWSKSKVKDPLYSNKKGWLAVCELIPGYHDQEIAEAEEKADIREAYIINQAFYDTIISAESKQTRPLVMPPDMDEADEAVGVVLEEVD